MAFVDELNILINKYPHPRRYVKSREELSDNIVYFRSKLGVSSNQLDKFLLSLDYHYNGYRAREIYDPTLLQTLALTDFLGISAEELLTYRPWMKNEAEEIIRTECIELNEKIKQQFEGYIKKSKQGRK